MSLNKIRADLNRPQALAERNEVWSGVVVIEDMSDERLRLLRDAPAMALLGSGNSLGGVGSCPRDTEAAAAGRSAAADRRAAHLAGTSRSDRRGWATARLLPGLIDFALRPPSDEEERRTVCFALSP